MCDHVAHDFELVSAPFDADLDALRHDDGVVGQHAQSDDEGAERDPLEQDAAHQVHDEEGRQDGDEQYRADGKAGASPHRDEQHHEDDANRLDEVEHEAVRRDFDRFRLEVDLVDLDSDRLQRAQLFELLAHRLAHGDDVSAAHRGDAEADGRLAVEAQDPPGRILIAARQRRHVAERQLRACAAGANDQVEHVVGRLEDSQRIDDGVLFADAHPPAVGGDVARLQLGVDLLLVDAEAREPLTGHLEVDHFLLLGEQVDLLDVLDPLQLAPQKLDVAAQLGIAVAIPGDREEDAVDVAEIVDDHRTAAHRGGQARLHVVDLAAQLVPHLRNGVGVESVLDDGAHHRAAARRLGFHPLELAELLDRAFDGVGDFLRDFGGAGSGVGRDDQRLLDRELGVLEPPHLNIGGDAAEDRDCRCGDDDAAVLDRELADVHDGRAPRALPRS